MGTTQSSQADRCSQADANRTASEGLRGLKSSFTDSPHRLVGSLVSEPSTAFVVANDILSCSLDEIEDTECNNSSDDDSSDEEGKAEVVARLLLSFLIVAMDDWKY